MNKINLTDDNVRIVQGYQALDTIGTDGKIAFMIGDVRHEITATPEVRSSLKSALASTLLGSPSTGGGSSTDTLRFSKGAVASHLNIDANQLDGLVSKDAGGSDTVSVDEIMPWLSERVDSSVEQRTT